MRRTRIESFKTWRGGFTYLIIRKGLIHYAAKNLEDVGKRCLLRFVERHLRVYIIAAIFRFILSLAYAFILVYILFHPNTYIIS